MTADSAKLTSKRTTHGLGKWLRRSLIAIACLVFLAALAIGGGMFWLRHAMTDSLPVLDGDLKLPGLSAPVTVRRDRHGVPNIEAANLDDLLMAQGYVTAQDRLWQMDVLRRNAAGELAELLGPSLVDHDKAQRVFQFRNVAQRVYSGLPESDRRGYEQYARGVNLFIEQHQDHLPAEFRLLQYQPHPWAGADSILIGLSMVETLDSHWYAKLVRERISADLHNPRLEAQLYPVGSWRDQPPSAAVTDMTQPHPAPTTDSDDDSDQARNLADPAGLPSLAELKALRTALDLPACSDCVPGSNNWVIAGKHTASGKPLLSNDMHLDLSVPNIWYMASLKSPELHVAGVSLPGLPLIVAGHNDHVAWGITALYGDTQDLYIEKLDGKGNYADATGSWVPLEHAREIIKVRFSNDVNLDVQITAHGPLVTPLLKHETRPLALHWSIYDPSLNTLPNYAMNSAGDVQQFTQALSSWCWPTLNMVYADDQGHIAYHAVGRVPIRPAGLVGVPIPTDQDHGQHEWKGYVPFDDMPNALDPPSGLLATANSRVTANDATYPLTLEWSDPYRAERVYMDLRGRDQLTRADMLAVQTDIYSEVDQELAHRFAYAIDQTYAQPVKQPGAPTEDETRMKQAADLLRSWDGRMTTDSAAASIILRTRQAFWPLILEPKLGKDADAYQWSESNFAEEEIILHGAAVPAAQTGETVEPAQTSPWLPSNYRNWDALLTDAVRKGLERGQAPADLSRWTYGSWHVVDLEHPIFGMFPVVKRWFGTGEKPQSGDTTTIKQVGRAFGPSQRFTMDWNDPDSSTENIVLGQSGNAASPWYRDQWPVWYGGTTFAMPFSSAAVAAQTTHTLRLVP